MHVAPSEDEIVAWLRRRGAKLVGDDAAILPAASWAVTTDSQIEGIHFLPGLDPAVVAQRLLAVNLSDLAAMGAHPRYAFLALQAPARFDHRRFLRAFTTSARQRGLELAGGDLAKSPHLSAVLTLLGKRTDGGRWLRRAGAEAGEALWLGGSVGESAAGLRLVRRGAALSAGKLSLPKEFGTPRRLARAARRALRRHLLPQPQLHLGRWLSRSPRGAAIDVSDGLARDLHRLCRESGVGAEVDWTALPRPRGFENLSERLGTSFRELALGGGEDYVLLFTLPMELRAPAELGCHRIGRIRRGRRILLDEDGEKSELPALGWDHLG